MNTEITYLIEELTAFALEHELIEKPDAVYCRNLLMDLLEVSEPWEAMGEGGMPCEEAIASMKQKCPADSPEPILTGILDYCAEKGILEEDTVTLRDLMDARIMGIFTARPSDTVKTFWKEYEESPEKASAYFYNQARCSHYIMTERVAKNLYWLAPTKYGDLEITVNLSKPEKDPKEIAKLKFMKSSSYPKCMLCIENVGYQGRLNHPARQNLRQIPMHLNHENWFLQYSPYVYYNEHCILLKEEHVPMKINVDTFRRLFAFIEKLPHYFIGSNAGLPVVGGSILNHEHYQGGHHVFPMEKASIRKQFVHPEFPGVSIGLIHWQMAGIRLAGRERDEVVSLAERILNIWEAYTDASVEIYAATEENGVMTPHNAITPIARFNQKGEYEIDLVLRNNRTSEEYPDGIFHPHPHLHHIKKENIGLIEVMGLAVLPGRLEQELSLIADILTGDKAMTYYTEQQQEALAKHAEWIAAMQETYGVVSGPQEARRILEKEVGQIFSEVLECAGVFKNNEEGYAAIDRFMDAVGCKEQA